MGNEIFFFRIEKDASVSKCREAIIIIKLHEPLLLNNVHAHTDTNIQSDFQYELHRRQQTTREYFSDLASRK